MSTNVFLTGASSGIGRETATTLCARGYRVWGTSRHVSRLPVCPGFYPVVVDLLDPAATAAAFARAEQESGGIDLLINNAGVGVFAPFEGHDQESVEIQFRLLFHAPLQLIRLALPRFRKRNAGRVINVTSLAARMPVPFLGPYGAAKAALSNASETLRYELCHTRIRIIELQPGDIRTSFHEAMERRDDAWRESYYPTLDQTGRAVESNIRRSPPASVVSRALIQLATATNPPPLATAGSFFQARLAPLGLRLFPKFLMEWAVRVYYGI